MEFAFDIVLPAPLSEMRTVVNYEEVRQASGVSYIILLFVRDSRDREVSVHEKLESIGVPARLHYIFARELSRMFDTEIVGMAPDSPFSGSGVGFDENRFNDYRIGDFELTERGRKLLLEGMLPSGQVRQKEVRVSMTFHDRGLDFSEDFSGVMRCDDDDTDARAELLRSLPHYETDETELRNLTAGFIAAHQTNRRIGLVRKEVIDSVEIAETSFLHVPVRLRLKLEYARDPVLFSVSSGNDETDSFLFKYLSGDSFVRALEVMNGTSGLPGELGLPDSFVPAKLGELPADILKSLSFRAGLDAGDTLFMMHSGEISDILASRKHGFRTMEISEGVMDSLPYRPLALKIGRNGGVLGCVPVRGDLRSSASFGPLAGISITVDLMAEYEIRYDSIRAELIRIMRALFSENREDAVPEIMSLFGVFDDAGAVLETVSGESPDGTDMIEGIYILCRSLAKDRTGFADTVKTETAGRWWNDLYTAARNLIINDDEIKDNIIYLTPRILNIAGFIGRPEGEILADFRSISDKYDAPETEQYYYFRALGFSEEAVLSFVNPFEGLDILKTEPKEQGTALDSLLSAVSGLRAAENTLGVPFLKSRDNLNLIMWNPDKAGQCREILKNVRCCLEAARPLVTVSPQHIQSVRELADELDFAVRKFSGGGLRDGRRQNHGGKPGAGNAKKFKNGKGRKMPV